MTPGEPLLAADPPIRVAVLASRSADRLRALLTAAGDDSRFDVVGGVVNDTDGDAIPRLAERDIPVTVEDIHAFYEARGADIDDMAVRRDFDDRVAGAIEDFDPELVVLAGYLHVVTDPVLERFGPAIVNVHHADLTRRDGAGRPVYAGLRAVADAVRAGVDATHATTHVVTSAVDAGPLLARSPPFAVHRALVDDALGRDADDVVDAYVYAHRRWMARDGGGPTLVRTVELLADGRVRLADGETRIDGTPGYYQLGEGVVRWTRGDGNG